MFWLRFLDECRRVGKKPNPVAAELGISSGTVTGWKNGSVPQQKYLVKLSEYFGCTTDYLIGASNVRNAINESSPDILTEQEKYLIECFRETTEEGRFEMIAAIMDIKKRIEKNSGSADSSRIG